ncbi:hypothetical protein K440DRAFT_238475 [Wilcoxina mikolae CBS 423.85]|nr:hypothetical protein K440DRAFT_238475 [Wilcoxina mikolae CBS 423.85]
MYLPTLLLLVLTPLVLAAPHPEPSWRPHIGFASRAYKRALERGIDPHGPHPTDFDHDNGESVTFKEDSDFAVWAAAQSGLKKRNAQKDGTNIDVVYVFFLLLFSLTPWGSSERLIRDTNTASGQRKGARVMVRIFITYGLGGSILMQIPSGYQYRRTTTEGHRGRRVYIC